MKTFFEGIQWLFDEILLAIHAGLRSLELDNWWLANIFSWAFLLIGCVAAVYWIKQLKLHEENNEENQDTTAHSFLK
jgi:hypothetical protein